MSFFDPYHISEYTGYYSKKGQVLQKRHVERNPALSQKDKEKAINILRSFGYKVIPGNYMPLEKYTYFDTKDVTYLNVGTLSPGESFQVKLRDLLGFMPSLEIFSQVSYNNVEEINISVKTTNYWLYSAHPPASGNLLITLHENFFESFVQTSFNNNPFRVEMFPDNENGRVNFLKILGSTVVVTLPANENFFKDRLTFDYTEGDKYLFKAIQQNDLSDGRFDINVFDTKYLTGEEGTQFPISNLEIQYSVFIEVVYKTYLP